MPCGRGVVDFRVEVDVSQQQLRVFHQGKCMTNYPVSTAKAGVGQAFGSYRTPLGLHVIRAKIGEGQPEGAVFVGRRPTGEIYSPRLASEFPGRDWILSRILWLSGCEPGFNRLGSVDTMRRYIYIHGCPDDCPMGRPESHGCIRMRNKDVIALFDLVPAYTPVLIHLGTSEK